jgi:hypothetical protein
VAPYVRSLVVSTTDGPGGSQRTRARLDDHFHGFEVSLDVRAGQVIAARAGSDRHPWTTCPGALASVDRLRGPVGAASDTMVALDRGHTCVHVNDLVWLASTQHPHRRYDIEVTPHGVSVQRDEAPLFGWRLESWAIVSPAPFAGLSFASTGWHARLEDLEADDDQREAVRVARRAMAVAMGYFELDWQSFATAADIEWAAMAGSCHTFSPARVERAERLAVVPDVTLFAPDR